MEFSNEPTARADDIACYVRQWYELNRETCRDRWDRRWDYAADEFILHLIGEVDRVRDAAAHNPAYKL